MQKSDELTQVYKRYIDTLGSEDVSAIEAMISTHPDVSVIGNDHGEWLVGQEAVLSVTRELMQRVAAGVSIAANTPQAFVEGNLGWVTDTPWVTLPSGRTTFRATMLFLKEGDAWRMIHAHTSFGLGNEVFGARQAA